MVPALDTFRKDNPRPTPIVTHVTEVKFRLFPEDDPLNAAADEAVTPASVRRAGDRVADHYRRVAAMMELLAGQGFVFRAGKKMVHGYSREMEADDTKRLLLAAGFKDREFQIVLEYTRGWGML